MNSNAMFSASSIINFLLILLRVIFLVFCFALIIWGLFSLIDFLDGGPVTPIFARYPVFLSYLDEGLIRFGNEQGVATIWIHRAPVIISSVDLSRGFVLLHMLLALFWYVCFLLPIHLTIQILEAIKKGEYFAVENAIRLRWIALLWIGITILSRSWAIISSIYLVDKLEFARLAFERVPFFQLKDVPLVAGVLFLLVIAEAFRAGALLKEESELTI